MGHLSLYKNLNTKQQKINLNPLKSYNFININFYNTYNKWFNKHLTIIGYQISEYSLDLKLANILSQKQSLVNEKVKIESKKRKNLSLRRGKIILHRKRIFKKKKQLFFKKKKFLKFKTLKLKALLYFVNLKKICI